MCWSTVLGVVLWYFSWKLHYIWWSDLVSVNRVTAHTVPSPETSSFLVSGFRDCCYLQSPWIKKEKKCRNEIFELLINMQKHGVKWYDVIQKLCLFKVIRVSCRHPVYVYCCIFCDNYLDHIVSDIWQLFLIKLFLAAAHKVFLEPSDVISDRWGWILAMWPADHRIFF